MSDSSRHQVSPAARAQARRVAQTIGAPLKNRSPRTEVATVVDTSFHQEQGYVLATASRGPIQVLGVPYNSVVPGMRMFVRRFSYQGQTSYLYDGLTTPAVSITTSGSIASVSGEQRVARTFDTIGSPPLLNQWITFPVLLPRWGMFWSFFYYLSSLPPPGVNYVLFSTGLINNPTTTPDLGGILAFVVNNKAQLGIYMESADNVWPTIDSGPPVTFWSDESYSPQRIWWFNYQLGMGLGVNGVQYMANNNDINYYLGGRVIPTSGGLSFAFSLGGGFNTAFSQTYPRLLPLPPASWVSKIVIGVHGDQPSNNAISPFPLTIFNSPSDSADAIAAAMAAATPTSDSGLIDLTQCYYGAAKYLLTDAYLEAGGNGDFVLPDNSGNGIDLVSDHTNSALRVSGPY